MDNILEMLLSWLSFFLVEFGIEEDGQPFQDEAEHIASQALVVVGEWCRPTARHLFWPPRGMQYFIYLPYGNSNQGCYFLWVGWMCQARLTHPP